MTTQTVMVTLPDEIYHRFQTSAHVMQQSVEALLAQSIQGNLPPSVEDLPPELQNEIGVFLQSLSSQALWEIVKAPSLPPTWQRQQELLEKNQEDALTAAEMEELEQLRVQIDRRVMRRSYALALLKWRGYAPPAMLQQRLEMAIQLYRDEEATLSRAAEIAALTTLDFQAILRAREIAIVIADATKADIDQGLALLRGEV